MAATIINLADVAPSILDASVAKLFFPANEASGATTVSDSSSTGLVLPTSAAVVNNGDGSILSKVNLDTAASSGTIPSPGAGKTFAFFGLFQRVGSFGVFGVGDINTGQGISLLIASAGTSMVKNASGAKNLNAVNSANPVKMMLVDNGTNIQLYTSAIGTLMTQSGANVLRGGDLTAVDNLATINDGVAAASGINFWGGMYCIFGASLPADIVVAADWTMEQWYRNNKTFYPRLTEV